MKTMTREDLIKAGRIKPGRSAAYRAAEARAKIKQGMTSTATTTRPTASTRQAPTRAADPHAEYRAEWSALPEAEQRRQGSIDNFVCRRINGLADSSGLPTLPSRK